MPVSGVGPSGFNPPAQPPTNGVSAYSYAMLGKISTITDALVAKGSQNNILNATLKAIVDFAEIHAALTALKKGL